MKHRNKNIKIWAYWFGRAFTATALLLSCALALLFGFGYCENKMVQSSGAPANDLLSLNENGLFFYGHRIF